MRSKLSAITARTPSSSVPLAAQSRDDPEPYSLPPSTISGTPSFSIVHRRVVNRHLLAVRQVQRPAAFGAGSQLVAQPNVGERAAHHHFVIAAPRAVGIEVPRLHAVRDQIFPGRAIHANRTGGRDVIGGDAVAQHRQHSRAADIGERRGSLGHVVEERRILDVGGLARPTRRDRPRAPSVPASAHRPGTLRRTPCDTSRS